MPNAPILGRTLLWEKLADGTVHVLDWHLVDTSLGTMVESRTLSRRGGEMLNEDLADSGYTAIATMSQETLYAQYNVGGGQWPHYRAGDPGVN